MKLTTMISLCVLLTNTGFGFIEPHCIKFSGDLASDPITEVQDQIPFSKQLENWPALSLQTYYEMPSPDLIKFTEANFEEINQNVDLKANPMVPLKQVRQFTQLETIGGPDIKWRMFTSGWGGSHGSGYSQGIGATTMLIEDELLMDVQVQKMHFNGDNDYYPQGDYYRVDTSLYWFPTDNFTMRLGIGTYVDR